MKYSLVLTVVAAVLYIGECNIKPGDKCVKGVCYIKDDSFCRCPQSGVMSKDCLPPVPSSAARSFSWSDQFYDKLPDFCLCEPEEMPTMDPLICTCPAGGVITKKDCKVLATLSDEEKHPKISEKSQRFSIEKALLQTCNYYICSQNSPGVPPVCTWFPCSDDKP